jgi:hypothetical protein
MLLAVVTVYTLSRSLYDKNGSDSTMHDQVCLTNMCPLRSASSVL